MSASSRQNSLASICVVTSTRADYGLLKPLLLRMQNTFNLQLIVTGTHLSQRYGMTRNLIMKDGFHISAEVVTDNDGDTPSDIVRAMGDGLHQYADVLTRLCPDLLLVLGDRYEILVAVYAATIFNIPIAHLAGGDITEGAFDDSIRHAITKLSHLHFVTNSISKKRVIQMGEDPSHVFNFGNPGLEFIHSFRALSKNDLEKKLGIPFHPETNLLVMYHPTTLNCKEKNREEAVELRAALEYLSKANKCHVIIIGSNADTYNKSINAVLNDFISAKKNVFYFSSLERDIFLSLAYHSSMLIGNSSSGVYEIPFLKKPVVNIGDRQKGRLRPNTVIDCLPQRDEIIRCVQDALRMKITHVNHVYPVLCSSKLITDEIRKISCFKNLLHKRYHENRNIT